MPIARKLEEKGEKVIYLNIGDPLKYDFQPPEHVMKALYEAVKEGYNYYSLSEGEKELREAIVEKEKKWNKVDLKPENILVTQGVSEAINFLSAILLDPGDEILIPEPAYPLYLSMPGLYDARVVKYSCTEENEWNPDVDDIATKITPKTRAIVVINPNNPTGAVYSEKTIKRILDLAAEHDIPVISDEIYDGIVFEGEFKSTASLSKDTLVIGLNGFSKTFLMTGWRLGYLYIYDPIGKYEDELRNAVIKMARTRLSASTPVQRAAIAALRGPLDHLKQMVAKLRERREYVYKRLKEIEGFETVKPKAAFYIFPRIPVNKWKDDRDFTLKLLLEKKVLVVHGSGFGDSNKNHIRIVFLPPVDILEEAFNRIEEFVKSA